MYAVTLFSVGWGVAAGEEGACASEAGAPYCGATDADGWSERAARLGLTASETPKIATRTKAVFSLWLPKFVVLFPAREWPLRLRKRNSLIAVLAPVRNVAAVCFEWVTDVFVCRPEPVRNSFIRTKSSRKTLWEVRKRGSGLAGR